MKRAQSVAVDLQWVLQQSSMPYSVSPLPQSVGPHIYPSPRLPYNSPGENVIGRQPILQFKRNPSSQRLLHHYCWFPTLNIRKSHYHLCLRPVGLIVSLIPHCQYRVPHLAAVGGRVSRAFPSRVCRPILAQEPNENGREAS
jgi:hypothetical protein